MQKRRPDGSGAVLLAGIEQALSTENHSILQPLDGLARYRALRLIACLNLAPEIAVVLAAVAFGGVG